METKKPWQSKTVVLNAVVGLLAAVAAFVPAAAGAQAWIGAHAVEIGMGWSILNVVLRAVTKDKISLSE